MDHWRESWDPSASNGKDMDSSKGKSYVKGPAMITAHNHGMGPGYGKRPYSEKARALENEKVWKRAAAMAKLLTCGKVREKRIVLQRPQGLGR